LLELLHDQVEQELLVRENRPQARDLVAELTVFCRELFLLEAGEAREPHLEDRLRLTLGEPVLGLLAGRGELRLGSASAAHELLETAERQRHQALSRLVG